MFSGYRLRDSTKTFFCEIPQNFKTRVVTLDTLGYTRVVISGGTHLHPVYFQYCLIQSFWLEVLLILMTLRWIVGWEFSRRKVTTWLISSVWSMTREVWRVKNLKHFQKRHTVSYLSPNTCTFSRVDLVFPKWPFHLVFANCLLFLIDGDSLPMLSSVYYRDTVFSWWREF